MASRPAYAPSSVLVDTGGAAVAVREWGAGPDVAVLVHGLGSSSRSFAPLAAELASELRVVAVDLPGFGDSTEPLARVTMGAYGRIVHRALRALKIERAIWIGHSMGGQVALRQAIDEPRSVERLVLLAPAGIETFSQIHVQWLCGVVTPEFVRAQTPAQIRANVAMGFHHLTPAARYLADERIALISDDERLRIFADACSESVRAMLEEPVSDELSRVRMPVLALFAEHDRLIPNPVLHPQLRAQDIADATRKLLQHAETSLIRDAGHMLHFERAAECYERIAAVLGLRRRRATGS